MLSPIREIFEWVFNRGDLARLDELVSLDLVTHLSSWGLPASRSGLKQMIAHLRFAFPDLHCTIEDEIRAEGKLAARWIMRGTHKGAYLGNQPTGRPIEVEGFIFARIAAGRIVENWILIDQMRLFQQLGIIPPPRRSIEG